MDHVRVEKTEPRKSLTSYQLALWLAIFSVSFNLISTQIGTGFTNTKIFLFVFTAVVLVPPYLSLRNLTAPKISPWFLILSVTLASVFTPTVLQTDQFRYIWDGLVSALGVNPYKFAPADFAALKSQYWVEQINHAELHSVYPPIAQVHFWISTWLNPFFWNSYLGITWLPELSPDEYWKVEFGWKVMVGLLSSALLLSFRGKRWDLILLHPLFLLMIIGNSHIDIIMVTYLCLAIKPVRYVKNEKLAVVLLGFSILSKWLSLVLVPAFLWKLKQLSNLKQSVTVGILLIAVISLSIVIYYSGANGFMFASTKVFAQNWIFFGYLHRIIADIFRICGSDNGIYLSKLVCAVIGLAYGGWVSRWYIKNWISLRLYSLLIVTGVLIVFPTIHPWYLVVLIPLGVPYAKMLRTPIIWPFLAILSEFFYVENKDPFVIRMTVYLVVTMATWLDFKLILKRVSKLSNA